MQSFYPERQQLLSPGKDAEPEATFRRKVYDLLEANNKSGMVLQSVIVLLIIVNVLCFMLSTESSLEGNRVAWFIFDAVELCTVTFFTTEYILRLYSIVEATDGNGERLYSGFKGRLHWALTDFYSWVDLASIVPFYVDIALVGQDLPATQFIRLARMLRMMKKGGFSEAFAAFDDIFKRNKKLVTTSLFVGLTTWLMLSSFYHIAERNNPDMIWIYPSCYSPYADDDEGQGPRDGRPDCPHRFGSILSSSYFTLLNLFGEFPLIDVHSTAGRFLGVFTAVVAVAVFAIPTGIFGAGFEDMIQLRKAGKGDSVVSVSSSSSSSNGSDSDFIPAYTPAPGSAEFQSNGKAAFPFLDTGTAGGEAYRALLFTVVVLDVLAFFASTVGYLQDGNVAGAGLALGALEVFSVAFFSVDYAARAVSASADGPDGLMRYVFSFYGLIDLFSVLPFFLGLPACGGLGTLSPKLLPTLVRALRLIRILKMERYVRAFSVFDDVIGANLDILAVSGFFAVVAWVFASSLLYYTERNGPDPNMTPYYQSVPMAMWVTLLNLSGEAPLCDYTAWGKLITGVLGVFGVGVFAVPVGLLGAGFEEWVESIETKSEENGVHVPLIRSALPGAGGGTTYSDYEEGQPSPGDEREKPFRKRLYAFLEARTTWGRHFESFIMLVIFVTVTQVIVMTMPSVCLDENHCPSAFDYVEIVAVMIFTVEYGLRIYAAPEAYPETSPFMARLRYSVSFYAVIDFLAVFPYYLARLSPAVDQYDNYLRLLRLLRILKLDKYMPCVSLIDDVFRLKARGLLVAGFASATMLAWFGTIMYLVERSDNEVEVGCFYESQRFSSVFNSLQYDLILLTGDYPLIDFTILGRYINFVQIVVAVGIVAVPSGLIANGFSQVLEEERNAKHAKRREAAILLQRQVRGLLARHQFMLTVEGARIQEEERKRHRRLVQQENETGLPAVQRYMRECYRFSTGVTDAGKRFDTFVGALIMLNVVAVIAESETTAEKVGGRWLQAFFDGFEAFSVLVFTAEIAMRLFIAPVSAKYGFSRWTYLCSFFGIVDIASIAPWYIEMVLKFSGVYIDASVFRVLRLFRILQLEHFVSAFTLLDDVWRSCRDTLAATGLLALVVWVGSACLFYLFEKDNECTGGAFSSIPDAMYYTAVFLGGEWGETDFTWPGKVLCCALCVMGIALFAIPVGTVFEAFNDVLEEVHCVDEMGDGEHHPHHHEGECEGGDEGSAAAAAAVVDYGAGRFSLQTDLDLP